MRYLLLSDIHSNDEALAAVLARARRRRFDRVVILGDFVGYGAEPNAVLDRLRRVRKDKIVIRGNHDKVVCGLDDGELFNPVALQAAPVGDAPAPVDVASNEALHLILNEWADIIAAHFDIYPLVDIEAAKRMLASQVAAKTSGS